MLPSGMWMLPAPSVQGTAASSYAIYLHLSAFFIVFFFNLNIFSSFQGFVPVRKDNYIVIILLPCFVPAPFGLKVQSLLISPLKMGSIFPHQF